MEPALIGYLCFFSKLYTIDFHHRRPRLTILTRQYNFKHDQWVTHDEEPRITKVGQITSGYRQRDLYSLESYS